MEYDQIVIFWLLCLFCLRPRLIVLLSGQNLPGRPDWTGTNRTPPISVSGGVHQHNHSNHCLFSCGLLTASGETVGFSQEEGPGLDPALRALCCHWMLQNCKGAFCGWEQFACPFQHFLANYCTSVWALCEWVSQSKVNSSEEQWKSSWNVLFFLCVPGEVWGFHHWVYEKFRAFLVYNILIPIIQLCFYPWDLVWIELWLELRFKWC